MSEAKEPSLWLPIQDRKTLAALSKLIEECGELASAAARCIAQGLDEKSPDTGQLNSAWLADEMADVMALISLVDDRWVSIDHTRMKRKFAMKAKWLDIIVEWEKEHGN